MEPDMPLPLRRESGW
uniref:Uncharacterized protein n=1 Tax=Leersia perrieri TaxID=77586 RepID=A0A0D9VWY6_9ORYZ